jgi:hypothetical protein
MDDESLYGILWHADGAHHKANEKHTQLTVPRPDGLHSFTVCFTRGNL